MLSAYRSYHGATGTSISLTGDPRRWANEPGIVGVVRDVTERMLFENELQRHRKHLEDLVVAALHDMNAKLLEIQRTAMGPLSGLGDLFGAG